jgi:hypothetical protein
MKQPKVIVRPGIPDPTAIKITLRKADRYGNTYDAIDARGSPLVRSTRTPMLDAARELLAMGEDPGRLLEAYHEGEEQWALRARLGMLAKLGVDESSTRDPLFREYHPLKAGIFDAD